MTWVIQRPATRHFWVLVLLTGLTATACSGSNSPETGVQDPPPASQSPIDETLEIAPGSPRDESEAQFSEVFADELMGNGATRDVAECYAGVMTANGIDSFEQLVDVPAENPSIQSELDQCSAGIAG